MAIAAALFSGCAPATAEDGRSDGCWDGAQKGRDAASVGCPVDHCETSAEDASAYAAGYVDGWRECCAAELEATCRP